MTAQYQPFSVTRKSTTGINRAAHGEETGASSRDKTNFLLLMYSSKMDISDPLTSPFRMSLPVRRNS